MKAGRCTEKRLPDSRQESFSAYATVLHRPWILLVPDYVIEVNIYQPIVFISSLLNLQPANSLMKASTYLMNMNPEECSDSPSLEAVMYTRELAMSPTRAIPNVTARTVLTAGKNWISNTYPS